MPAALAERPSVVRLAYRTGSDAQDLVRKRIEAVRALIRNGWTAAKGRYPLMSKSKEASNDLPPLRPHGDQVLQWC